MKLDHKAPPVSLEYMEKTARPASRVHKALLERTACLELTGLSVRTENKAFLALQEPADGPVHQANGDPKAPAE